MECSSDRTRLFRIGAWHPRRRGIGWNGGGQESRGTDWDGNAGAELILLCETRRDIPIKGHHDGFLRILAQPLPAIPTDGATGGGGIDEPGKGLGERLLLHVRATAAIHLVGPGIVLIADGLGGRTIQIEKIGFYIGFDEGAVEGGSPALLSNGRLGGKGGVAVLGWGPDLVATGTCRDSQIVVCLTAVVLAARKRLVLQRLHLLVEMVLFSTIVVASHSGRMRSVGSAGSLSAIEKRLNS